eukprot:gene26069-33568_t
MLAPCTLVPRVAGTRVLYTRTLIGRILCVLENGVVEVYRYGLSDIAKAERQGGGSGGTTGTGNVGILTDSSRIRSRVNAWSRNMRLSRVQRGRGMSKVLLSREDAEASSQEQAVVDPLTVDRKDGYLGKFSQPPNPSLMDSFVDTGAVIQDAEDPYDE